LKQSLRGTRSSLPDIGLVKINGLELRRLREERYLSIRELAKVARVANYTVAAAETGKCSIVQPRTLRKLAEALNVHPRELVKKME
jgi:transcriptional regulator with XRE-family HTH domain